MREFASYDFGRFVLSKRELVIVALLERWDDLVAPGAKLGVAGDGDACPRMPLTYTPTVREVERLLGVMRQDRWRLWWHVAERYLKCRRAAKDVPVKRKGRNGKTATVLERRVVTSYDPLVRLDVVELGVAWLAQAWARDFEPELPVCRECRRTIAECFCGLTVAA